MEPFVLLLALADAHPALEVMFLPTDPDRAARAGLPVEDTSHHAALGNFEIQRDPLSSHEIEGSLASFEIQLAALSPDRALPLSDLSVVAEPDTGVTVGRSVGLVSAAPLPSPYPVPVLGLEAVSGLEPSPFVVDGVEAEGVIVLTDGADVVGVLGHPVIGDGRGDGVVPEVHLVVTDTVRW
jgi:hypothetical protein